MESWLPSERRPPCQRKAVTKALRGLSLAGLRNTRLRSGRAAVSKRGKSAVKFERYLCLINFVGVRLHLQQSEPAYVSMCPLCSVPPHAGQPRAPAESPESCAVAPARLLLHVQYISPSLPVPCTHGLPGLRTPVLSVSACCLLLSCML